MQKSQWRQTMGVCVGITITASYNLCTDSTAGLLLQFYRYRDKNSKIDMKETNHKTKRNFTIITTRAFFLRKRERDR